MQRSAHPALCALVVQGPRRGQGGVDVDVHEGVELRVQAFDRSAGMAHQGFGAERALAHGVPQVGQRAAGEKAGLDGHGRAWGLLRVHRAAPWRGADGRRGPTPGRTCSIAHMPTAVATEAATNMTE